MFFGVKRKSPLVRLDIVMTPGKAGGLRKP